jgi:hypothetical protein
MPDFFSSHFFSSNAKPKVILRGAKPFSMVLPPLVGLFLKNGLCSKLPACRLISNDTLYFIYKFALRRLGDNIDHFQSFEKAGRTSESFRAQISSISLRTVCRLDFSDTLSLTQSNSVILRTWSSKHTQNWSISIISTLSKSRTVP